MNQGTAHSKDYLIDLGHRLDQHILRKVALVKFEEKHYDDMQIQDFPLKELVQQETVIAEAKETLERFLRLRKGFIKEVKILYPS